VGTDHRKKVARGGRAGTRWLGKSVEHPTWNRYWWKYSRSAQDKTVRSQGRCTRIERSEV